MRKTRLVVQKYGGSSLATPGQIREIADRVARLQSQDVGLIVVVSAMGKSTDELIDLAYQVSPHPIRRELDMLVSTGERVSMALLSMAINDRKCKAMSLTGSQAGVLTDDAHSNARIIDIKPIRIESEMNKNHVVVIAGFQGVSPNTKEITTLGRGGSDTTAVALAAYFKADHCEILKDVEGVFSADPRIVPEATKLQRLHYLQLMDMSFWGAKVLHYRSAELAYLLKVPISIGLANGSGEATHIDGDSEMFEQARILSVNSHKEVRWIEIRNAHFADAVQDFYGALRENNLPPPQVIDTERRETSTAILIAATPEYLTAITQVCQKSSKLRFDATEFSSVSATCKGSFTSQLPDELAAALARKKIVIHKMLFSAMSITMILDGKDRERAIAAIHEIRDGKIDSGVTIGNEP